MIDLIRKPWNLRNSSLFLVNHKMNRLHVHSFVFITLFRAEATSFCLSLLHDQSSEPKESTLEKVSDESFVLMEKLCDQTMAKINDESLEDEEEDLLDGIEVPNFNDTLEEVEFILEMGSKLKAKPTDQLHCVEPAVEDDLSFMNDTQGTAPCLQPPLKRLKLSSGVTPVLRASTPNTVKPITSLLSFVSPLAEFSSCRSMINQVCIISSFPTSKVSSSFSRVIRAQRRPFTRSSKISPQRSLLLFVISRIE